MTYPRTRRTAALVATLALASVTAFSAGLSGNAASAAAEGAPDIDNKQAVVSADRKVADEALDAVQEVFKTRSAADARATLAAGGTEATLALRDLAQGYDSLSESDREMADSYLARPTSNGGDNVNGFTVKYDVNQAPPACNADLCVHYVASTDDAPSLTDTKKANGTAGANGIPDYVDRVLRVMTEVHDTYINAGYREPRGDGARGGGSNLIDIYLAELGAGGVYGYCTTDQPNPQPGDPAFYDRWAYCVLDNDYAGFPNTVLENIQVTAAHEYFHATQYAYDAFEDSWFLEATATWAEDEVYDQVNDNVQYLKYGPMKRSAIPVDTFESGGLFHYGTWSFFRFLTEKYTAKKGGMPRLVLAMMKKVDGSLGARDQFSWQAVNSVLKSKKTTAAKQFLNYSVANRRPRQTYNEGKGQKYPTGPLRSKVTLTPKRSKTRVATTKMDHLTAATYRIAPKNLKRKKTKLKVILDMAPKSKGSMAAITVVPKKGKTKVYSVNLNGKGNGSRKVPFSSRKVKFVEVTLANTSARFTNCYQYRTPYSCSGGTPKHDNRKQKISARVK